jgi:hypothetical protein
MQAVGRERTIRAYHLDALPDIRLTDMGMPVLEPCDVVPDDLIGFNYATGRKATRDRGVHFFIDDYQFERVWREPERYAEVLRPYQCALAPDFSLYRDMPAPMQRWNCYRSRFVGAVWQQLGLNVIPTLQWSDEASFEYCFDGMPEKATLAVSTLGTLSDPYSASLWRAGMDEAVRRLKPRLVLLYGRVMPGYEPEFDFIRYENDNVRRLKWVDAEHRAADADQEQEEALEALTSPEATTGFMRH